MKLHLPKGLFTALLACCSLSTSFVTTVASSTVLVGTVALTWSPQALATDTVFIYTGATDTITQASNALVENEDSTWSITDIREGGSSWNGWFIANNGATNATMNNVIRFVSDSTYESLAGTAIGTTKATTFDANNVCIGGITVDVGATGYSFSGKGTTSERYFNLYGVDSTDAESHALFDINEDFSFTVNGNSSAQGKNINLKADVDVKVALGKVFSVNGNFNGTADRTLYLLGGGTMDYTHSASGSHSAGAMNWDISQSSTLNIKGSSVNLDTVLGTGSVTFTTGTLAIEASNKTLTNNIVVGAGGGTISGTNLELAGSITYAAGSGKLQLVGSFTLGADFEFDLGAAGRLANGEYILFKRDNDTTTLDFSLSDINIVNIEDPLRISSLQWVDNELKLVVADVTSKTLTFASGDLSWDLDAGTSPWTSESAAASFDDGDTVIIGEGSAGGGTITIVADVSPRSVTVTGEGDWEFTGSNGIIAGSLLKSGTGTLTLSTSNSYSGGTSLTGGTLILNAANAAGTGTIAMSGADSLLDISSLAALGAAQIRYSSGTIKYGTGMTDSLHDKITLTSEATNLILDVNGNSLTWGAAISTDFTLSNSGADATFSYAHNFAAQTIGLASNITMISTTSTTDSGLSLSGEGTLRVENTAGYVIYGTAGFTGTIETTNGGSSVIFNRHNTENDRFALSILGAGTQAVVLGGPGWNSSSTLYLSGLSGIGNISVSNNTVVMNRSLDILMSEDNTYHGNFYEANGAGGGRMGTLTIGGAYTFNWTGMTTSGAYSSIGTNAKLLIKSGATMNFALNDTSDGGGQWADDITIESEGKLLISRTDATGFVQRESGNEISGDGRIEITGTATLNGANTYTGGTTVSGTLTLASASAHSTGALTISSTGTVIATAGLTVGAGQTVTNEGSLTLGGMLSIAQTVTNASTGTITLNAGTIFDLSGLTGEVLGDQTVYSIFANEAGGTLDFSALAGADGLLDLGSIEGVTTVGLVWKINADGTITSEADANSLVYSAGNTLLLSDGAAGFDGGVSFADGNSISFTTADVALNLAGNVNSSGLRIVGVAVEYTGGAYTLTTPSIFVEEGGSFIQNDTTLSESTNFVGEVGTSLVFNIGDGNSVTRNEQLEGFLGDVIVRSGTLVIDSDASGKRMDMNSLIVEAGAALTTTSVTFEEVDNIPIFLQGSASDSTQRATWNIGDATVYGAITSSGYSAINVSSVLYVDQVLTSTGDLALDIMNASTVQLQGGLAGSGKVTVTGDGILDLSRPGGSTHTHTGDLEMLGGTLYLGSASGYDHTSHVQFDKIIMGAGTTLRLGMAYNSTLDSVNLILNGATISHTNYGGGGDNDVALKSLQLTGDNTFNMSLKAAYTFGKLTGMGNMEVTGASNSGNIYRLSFDEVVDFGGTFTGVNNGQLNIEIANVAQAAGITGTITNVDVNSSSFEMDGEGSFIIDQNLNASVATLVKNGNLEVGGTLSTLSFTKLGAGTATIATLAIADSGLLQMTYEGTLEVTTYSFTGGLRLRYDAGLSATGGLIELDNSTLTGVDTITVDLIGYDLAALQAGINLGISKEYDLGSITVLGLTDYDIVADGDFYKLTATSLVDLGWDMNWGDAVLAERPVAVPKVNSFGTGTTYLYDATSATPVYTSGATTSVELTGGGGAGAQVIGIKEYGSNAGAEVIETDVWIKATGGTFDLIAGGSVVNNWQNSNTMELRGDTHIEVDGASVGHIVGGSLREGGHSLVTGDSYISVFTNTVTGSIVGAGTSRHTDGSITSRRTTFTGDTNIYVYTPLTASTAGVAGAEAMTNDSIIGGHHWGSSATVGFAFNGNTNVTIDLSSYTGAEATMVKNIIGGGRVGASSVYTHTGNTYIDIKGHEDVTFDDWIMGGIVHYGTAATSTINGDTHIYITGDSTFTARVTGGANHAGGTASITGESSVIIDGGTFYQSVMGGFNQLAGTTTIGSIELRISAGTFHATVGAGGIQGSGTMTITGDSSILIVDGTFNQGLYGGSIDVANASVNEMTGAVDMRLRGGTYTTAVAGGSRITDTHTGSATAGDITITLDGVAELNGDLIGGHHQHSTNTGSTLSVGNVAINLLNGKLAGDVYAAGFLAAVQTTASQTSSTTVQLSNTFDLSAAGGVTISGGYGGAGATSGAVTGDRTLIFSSGAAYANLANVTFADFDIINVVEQYGDVTVGGLAAMASVEKTGTGALTLAAEDHITALTVSSGLVKLAANSQANSITSISVAAGAALDMSAASTGVNGALTLHGGSTLFIQQGTAGAQIGTGGSLTFVDAATTQVSIGGLAIAAGEDVTETLFTGLALDDISGITWDSVALDNGMQGVRATDYLTSDQDLTGFYLAYDAENSQLILTNAITSNLVWAGGAGEWNTVDGWLKESDTSITDTFEDDDNVTFNAGTGTVTINDDVTATTVLFTGASTSYDFTGSALTVSDSLSLEEGASASFESIVLSTTDVTIGETSSLTITNTATMASLSNQGALTVGSDSATANLILTSATTAGGDVTVHGSMELQGANTFGLLSATGDVTITAESDVASLSMAAGSTITGAFSGTGLTVEGGDDTSITTVGSITGTFNSLSHSSLGTLSVGADLTVEETFENTGTVSVTGVLTLKSLTSSGGHVSANSVVLVGGDTFSSINTTGSITSTGTLELAADSAAASISGVTGLTVTAGTLEVSTVDETSLTSISGEGNLSVGGALQLTSASNINDLTLGSSLTLQSTLIVGGTLTAASDLEVTFNNTIDKSGVSLTVASIATTQNINFVVTDLNGLGLSSGDVYTLMTGGADSLTGVTIDSNASATVGSYTYSISINGANVELLATLDGNSWESTSGDWNSVDSWSGEVPSDAREAIFDGQGLREVNVGTAAAASNIIVDIADGIADAAYTISSDNGSSLSTSRIDINKGTLTLNLETSVVAQSPDPDPMNPTGTISLGEAGILNIGAAGDVSAVGVDMHEGASLTVAEGGSLIVDQAFDGAGASVTNDGTLSLGAGSTLDTLDGTGHLELTGATVIATLSTATLQIDDSVQLTTRNDVTVSGVLSGRGNIDANDITLSSVGNTANTIGTSTLTLGGVLETGSALLSVNTLSADVIKLDMLGFDETTATGSYTIIGKLDASAAGHSWDTFELSDADKTAFNVQKLAGNDVVRVEENGELKLVITEANGRIWDTANTGAVTPGLETADPSMWVEVVDATGKIAGYDALDTVQGIVVTTDVDVDLTGLALDPADTDGLILRNVGGMQGATMHIIGDGEDASLATLFNSKDSFAQNAIDVTDATLQVDGENGATLELEALSMSSAELNVLENGNLKISSVELTDSSITVAAGASANLGEVNLLGTSSLEKADGATFIVDILNGGKDSTIIGDVEVEGTGGNFQGNYATNTLVIVDANASQQLTVSENLSVEGHQGATIALNMDVPNGRQMINKISTVGSLITLSGNEVNAPLTIVENSSVSGGSLQVSLDAKNMESLLNGESGVDVQHIMTGKNPRLRSTGSSFTLDGVDIYVSALTGDTDTGSLDLTDLTQSSDIVIGILHDNLVDNGHSIFLEGATMNKYFSNIRLLADGSIVVDLNKDGYGSLAQTVNGTAGLGLMGDAIISLNSQLSGSTPQYQDLANVAKTLDTYLASGNAAAADKVGAAVAGSSVTSLGSSMLASVEQQLKSARNRTTTMGGNTLAIKGEPVFGAWISAEGSKNTLDSDGTASGHDYDSWGGSLGVYTDLSESLTLGMAFTALHGTLSSSAADSASGDLDTYGVSVYAVKLDGRWTHTFAASVNMADATLDRLVTHANGSYSTQGETDGYGLGLMYELGYTYALSKDNTTSWQPILNVALVHANMSGYTETGSDAALSVSDQSSTYMTLGLGGRIESAFGETLVNRKAVVSGRAMLKIDAGSRYTEADVAFTNNAGVRKELQGAEPGIFGVELGAGLRVPVGMECGIIFVDAGLELRSGMNNMNASVGYQLQF